MKHNVTSQLVRNAGLNVCSPFSPLARKPAIHIPMPRVVLTNLTTRRRIPVLTTIRELDRATIDITSRGSQWVGQGTLHADGFAGGSVLDTRIGDDFLFGVPEGDLEVVVGTRVFAALVLLVLADMDAAPTRGVGTGRSHAAAGRGDGGVGVGGSARVGGADWGGERLSSRGWRLGCWVVACEAAVA
jgi:hypothetical protein